jgi:DNA-binding NarL/FixJ family response regulator
MSTIAQGFYEKKGLRQDGDSQAPEGYREGFQEIRTSKNEREMGSQRSALIIARSGRLRESLLVLLRAIPQIARIYRAEDVPAALSLSLRYDPVLVLCDYDLSQDGTSTMLRQIKTRWPQARCVALVKGERERVRAQAAGVDVALIKGVLAARLLETIETLLSQPTAKAVTTNGTAPRY